MNASKDIRPDCEEPHTTEETDNGSFFKKYTVLTPPQSESIDQPIFKKYVPLRVSDEYETDQPIPEEADSLGVSRLNQPIKPRSRQGTTLLLWSAVAISALLLAGWIVFYEVRHTEQPEQVEATQPPPAPEASTNSDSVPVTAESLVPESAVAPEEESETASVSSGSRGAQIASSNMLLNVMLARAREFEDRGMLMRAEEEYRAAVGNFPQDKLGQDGLKRVQTVLSEKQRDEKSAVSREMGLKEFRMSDFSAAEKNLAAAVDAGRSDTATLYALGMSYLKLGSFTQAQRALENCMAGNPDYAPALVGLAQVNAATGRKQEALPLLQRALELGGGAEFTPAKIKEMMFRVFPEQSTTIDSRSAQPAVQRSVPTFYAHAVHAHDLVLSSCRGELSIVNSVLHFNASNPDHSFHVLLSEVTGAHIQGRELQFSANGKIYRFSLNGRSPQDFLDALVPVN
jgi:tetratricopeptide (TPR) repeat protein